jgi:putative membrane protein
MKKAIVLASALALATTAGVAAAGQPEAPPNADRTPTAPGATTQLSKQDTDFLHDAAQTGMAEVRLGQVATKQGTSDDVRKFAQRMIDDHNKLNGQLTHFAQQRHGVVMPQEVDKKQQRDIDRLSQETGAKFDREYIARMIQDHEADLKEFTKQAKDGKDPELKQLAASAIPILQEHLTQAREIESRLKK